MNKILITKDNKKFFIKKEDQDVHTQFGYFPKELIKNAKPGDVLETQTGKKMNILEANFLDRYQKIKRAAQIIPLKDIGAIIAYTGLNSKSIVLDTGAGSGGLSCFLATIVKKVYSLDIRDDHLEIVYKNIESFGLKNIITKKLDIYDENTAKKIKQEFDTITLDLPEPWQAIHNVRKLLKVGGYVVSYSPCITQVMKFVEEITSKEDFIHLKTIEIAEKEWYVQGRKVRPKGLSVDHSGFLTFGRKISNVPKLTPKEE